MAKRNSRTKMESKRVQAHGKRRGTRQKEELRVAFDVEGLRADGYRLIGFEEEK